MALRIKRNKPSLPKLNTTISTNTTNGPQLNTIDSVSKLTKETLMPLYQNQGPIEIIPGLYLGTQHDANNTKHLIKLGIDSILNVAEEVDSKPNSPFDGNESAVINYLSLEWCHYEKEIMSYFDTAFEFIDQARINRKKKVLVHCQLGVSRSATLIIAYLMYKINYTCHEAYNFVKSKSCKVAPNLHLFTQLIQYEIYLKKSKMYKSCEFNSQLPSKRMKII